MKRIDNFPVMPEMCKTCPFREDESGRHKNVRLVSRIQCQVMTEASQICHHPRVSGHVETHLCRGARDYQLTLFYRLGFIESPTDGAWDKRRNCDSECQTDYE